MVRARYDDVYGETMFARNVRTISIMIILWLILLGQHVYELNPAMQQAWLPKGLIVSHPERRGYGCCGRQSSERVPVCSRWTSQPPLPVLHNDDHCTWVTGYVSFLKLAKEYTSQMKLVEKMLKTQHFRSLL